VLGVGDDGGLLGVRFAVDPEELLLERATVVEREDVQPVVVSGVHEGEYSRAVRGGVERSIEWVDDDLRC
jgi:hypothetical protein